MDFQIVDCGRHDCSDMHSWGPAMRSINVIHYIIKGKGFYETGNKKYSVRAGQSFVIYPYSNIHYYPDPDDPWEYIWMDFRGRDYIKLLEKIQFAEGNCVIGTIPREIILPLFEHLLKIHSYEVNKLSSTGLGYAILCTYADIFPDSSSFTDDCSFSKAMLIIKSNYYKEDFSIEWLCTQMNISRATLYRMFRSFADCSPSDYLLDYRIKQARIMLRQGLSVKSTALSCGFWDPLYFSRVFKKQVGIAPKLYKEQNRE